MFIHGVEVKVEKMIRDSFFLTKIQKEKLKKEANKKGMKTAELLRRIIDEYFDKKDGK